MSYFAKPNYIVYDEWVDNDFKKITKNKIKFNIKKKIIDSLSIFEFEIILGILLFFVSRSKKNNSNLTNKSILLEKRF